MKYSVYCHVIGSLLMTGTFSECYEFCERKRLYIVEREGDSGTIWSVK